VYPSQHVNQSLIPPASSDSFTTVGGGKLPCPGLIDRDSDIGFSRLFSHKFAVADLDYGIIGIDFLRHFNLFAVADLDYGIIGIDFLRHFNLVIDVTNNKLSESLDIDRCNQQRIAPTSTDRTF